MGAYRATYRRTGSYSFVNPAACTSTDTAGDSLLETSSTDCTSWSSPAAGDNPRDQVSKAGTSDDAKETDGEVASNSSGDMKCKWKESTRRLVQRIQDGGIQATTNNTKKPTMILE